MAGPLWERGRVPLRTGPKGSRGKQSRTKESKEGTMNNKRKTSKRKSDLNVVSRVVYRGWAAASPPAPGCAAGRAGAAPWRRSARWPTPRSTLQCCCGSTLPKYTRSLTTSGHRDDRGAASRHTGHRAAPRGLEQQRMTVGDSVARTIPPRPPAHGGLLALWSMAPPHKTVPLPCLSAALVGPRGAVRGWPVVWSHKRQKF